MSSLTELLLNLPSAYESAGEHVQSCLMLLGASSLCILKFISTWRCSQSFHSEESNAQQTVRITHSEESNAQQTVRITLLCECACMQSTDLETYMQSCSCSCSPCSLIWSRYFKLCFLPPMNMPTNSESVYRGCIFCFHFYINGQIFSEIQSDQK